MNFFVKCLAVLFTAYALVTAPAAAEPTDVTVRVIAKGAKFIGDSMGGVRIVLRDAATGAILAEGVTTGGTGDTNKIMREGIDRYGARWTPGAAAFNARLDIDAPVKIRVEATGPLAQPQSALTVTSEQWVVPGHPVTGGDAWLLEMPGFAVDILTPAAHSSADGEITIAANVVMMCGCPVTPGGLWNADAYDIKAMIYRNGEQVDEVTLEYAGEASQFKAMFFPKDNGAYQIIVVAFDEASGNTGLDRTSVLVR
ncbi:hypothetical protein [Hyphococcus sp.]|uniref:hypothetical protein n=1 Tax=Hyphococcus sp. TaxID=2038636 RepID=UPI003CCC214E